MKLTTFKNGRRDGRLLVAWRDLLRAVAAPLAAPLAVQGQPPLGAVDQRAAAHQP